MQVILKRSVTIGYLVGLLVSVLIKLSTNFNGTGLFLDGIESNSPELKTKRLFDGHTSAETTEPGNDDLPDLLSLFFLTRLCLYKTLSFHYVFPIFYQL